MNRWLVRELSSISKVPVSTLHYYDRIGLVKPHQSKINRYRLYNQTDLEKILQIQALKSIGFGLKQISHLIQAESLPPKSEFLRKLVCQEILIKDKIRTLEKALLTIEVLKQKGKSKAVNVVQLLQLNGVSNMLNKATKNNLTRQNAQGLDKHKQQNSVKQNEFGKNKDRSGQNSSSTFTGDNQDVSRSKSGSVERSCFGRQRQELGRTGASEISEKDRLKSENQTWKPCKDSGDQDDQNVDRNPPDSDGLRRRNNNKKPGREEVRRSGFESEKTREESSQKKEKKSDNSSGNPDGGSPWGFVVDSEALYDLCPSNLSGDPHAHPAVRPDDGRLKEGRKKASLADEQDLAFSDCQPAGMSGEDQEVGSFNDYQMQAQLKIAIQQFLQKNYGGLFAKNFSWKQNDLVVVIDTSEDLLIMQNDTIRRLPRGSA